MEDRPIEALRSHAKKARTPSDKQVAEIAGSINEFGWNNPDPVDGE